MMPALQRTATGRATPRDLQDFELLGLQALPHTTECKSNETGSTEFPNCSCGLSIAIQHSGGRAQR